VNQPPFPDRRTKSVYDERSITFLGLWSAEGWRFKAYFLTAFPEENLPIDVEAAVRGIVGLVVRGNNAADESPRAGFLGIHRGTRGYFLFVDWWANSKELYQRTFYCTNEQVPRFEETTGSDPVGCVWDVRLLGRESNSWVNHVLSGSPSIQGYLEDIVSSWDG
jgi:hypothetical protein